MGAINSMAPDAGAEHRRLHLLLRHDSRMSTVRPKRAPYASMAASRSGTT
ncbi:MAG: hypothetical protein R2878_02220 [Thermoleophilia bacterium]